MNIRVLDRWSCGLILGLSLLVGLTGASSQVLVPQVVEVSVLEAPQKLTQEILHRIFMRVNIERISGDGKYASNGAGDGVVGVDFRRILEDHGFSTTLEGLSFADAADGRRGGWNRVIFRGITFRDCDFGKGRLEAAVFEYCELDGVNFEGADLRQARFDNTHVFRSRFVRALANAATFSGTSIRGSDFSHAHFSYARFIGTQLVGSNLQRAVFLNAEVDEATIYDTDLTDVFLLDTREQFCLVDCTAPFITRPLVGMAFKFGIGKKNLAGTYNTREAEPTFEKLGVYPVRLDMVPPDIDTERLDVEVRELIAQAWTEGASSVAQAVIERAPPGSEIAKLRDRATQQARYMDAIFFTGGLNIEKEFQFPGIQDNNGAEPDFRRTIFEFSLLKAVEDQQMKAMGVCRTIQLLNVWRGGTLRNIEGHMGVGQTLRLEEGLSYPAYELMHEIAGDQIVAISMHKNAIDKLGDGLEVTYQHDGIVKGVISHDLNLIATQFHPELHSDWDPTDSDIKNRNFLSWLVDRARDNYQAG